MTPPPAVVERAARPAVRGTVVAADDGARTVTVRHAPFDGMPAMTMTFRVGRGEPMPHAGDAVRAVADERSAPWTLSRVRAVPAANAPAPRAFVPALREGDAVPAIALVDERGRAFSFARTRGATRIVSFTYTRCRDARMCPLVAAKFARMQAALRGTPIRLATITLDPAYDVPAVLRRYGAAFGADPSVWSLLTGTQASIDAIAARFGIALARPSPGIVAHTEAVVVVDADGRVAKIVDGAAWGPDEVIAEARAAAGMDGSAAARVALWLGSSASALCGGRAGGISAGATLLVLAAVIAAFGVAARRAFRRAA